MIVSNSESGDKANQKRRKRRIWWFVCRQNIKRSWSFTVTSRFMTEYYLSAHRKNHNRSWHSLRNQLRRTTCIYICKRGKTSRAPSIR